LRVFAISDIHVDFQENYRWFQNLSRLDYTDDLLMLAGDVTDSSLLFEKTMRDLRERFREVFFIPGNHDLWVYRSPMVPDSLAKFQLIRAITADCGIRTEPFHWGKLSVIPLYGWYDYSFAEPAPETFESWVDFIACQWPDGFDEKRITRHFLDLNEPFLKITNEFIISFSHFLPRIDLMPVFIPVSKRSIYPVLGTSLLENQIRRLGSAIHVYGHSHVNTQSIKDNVLYVNNAFGYPYETAITAKKLKCVYEI
jgi:predicted phosphodiesterase